MGINRKGLQKLSRIRIEESKAPLDSKHYHGAYYLAGYAVECSLKACVAKQIRSHTFPDKSLAQKAHTHNLGQLVKLAGLELELAKSMQAAQDLRVNWATIIQWSETSRYDTKRTRKEARDIYLACTDATHGVLTWIEARW